MFVFACVCAGEGYVAVISAAYPQVWGIRGVRGVRGPAECLWPV